MSQRKSVARKSMKRQSKVSRKSMARKSMHRKSNASGGRRKSMGKGGGKKRNSLEKPGAQKLARRGRDKFTYPNGDKYEGDWLAVYPDIFVRDGEGTYIFDDGTIYNGLWELDLLETGTIIWPCGQKYSGDFREGKMHGIGTYIFPGRGELSGTFKENLPVGNVVFLDMAGMKYAGRIQPNAPTARLKMMNHLIGGFSKEELILPEPPKGMDDDESTTREGRDNSKKKESRRQSSKQRKSKSKSTTSSRKSMKRKSMTRKSKAK
uniref:Phosphatidylinositol 4-phosphate 5-kinase 7 n=1 Tax=Lygus hesperus TaxID=30085 RepID=A0A0A9XED1_LYGHE